MTMPAVSRYSLEIEPPSAVAGGGFLALVPGLPRCMSEDVSPEQAVANVQDAIATRIEAARDMGHELPQPSRHPVLEALQQ